MRKVPVLGREEGGRKYIDCIHNGIRRITLPPLLLDGDPVAIQVARKVDLLETAGSTVDRLYGFIIAHNGDEVLTA